LGTAQPCTQTPAKTLKPCGLNISEPEKPYFVTVWKLGKCEKKRRRPMSENPKHLLDTTSESTQRPSKIAKTVTESEDHSDEEEEQQQPEKPMIPNPKIQRYLVAIEYIGTRFSGSQQQPNCRTVVGVLQVLSLFLFYFVILFRKYIFVFALWSKKKVTRF
jgi:hypothetical protein